MMSIDPASDDASPMESLNLGVIGNCSINALIDCRARLRWCCVPRFDSDPIFHALLAGTAADPRDGAWTIELEDAVRTEQRYDDGSAILRTQLFDRRGGGIEITDFAPRFWTRDRMFRPAQIVRRVRPLHGHPRVRFCLRPRGNWGDARPEITRGSNHLRFVLPGVTLRLTTNAPITYLVDETWFTLQGPASFLLGPDETLSGGIEDTAREFEEHTAQYWREWTRRLALPLEWQDAVIRAAITLKLCQYEETGAIVAAMTTSIPEAPNSGRNWDYRFCWLRDAFFVVRALNSLSEISTMEDYLRWLQDVVRVAVTNGDEPHVQPLYGIGLERELPERIVAGLAGFRGMGPVRCGNQAFEHRQHDVYGNVVLGAAQAFYDHRLSRRANIGDLALLEAMGEQAWRLHDQPDAGMWELRTRARVHTSSSLMCWAACDRLARISRALGLPQRVDYWSQRAETIRTTLLARAWNPQRRAFTAAFDSDDLDASVLLMAEVGFIDPRNERFVSTVRVLEQTLGDGPHLRRYEAPDDFGAPEVAFNVCAFWRIDALARIGETERAREFFCAMLANRNHLGLLSEDIAPVDGTLWGNFPQTYSMVGIINGAMRLSRPWDDAV